MLMWVRSAGAQVAWVLWGMKEPAKGNGGIQERLRTGKLNDQRQVADTCSSAKGLLLPKGRAGLRYWPRGWEGHRIDLKFQLNWSQSPLGTLISRPHSGCVLPVTATRFMLLVSMEYGLSELKRAE